MKITGLALEEIDHLWDDIKVMYDAADSVYTDMMLDLDEGNKLVPSKQKALTDRLQKLEHAIRVFRSETDV